MCGCSCDYYPQTVWETYPTARKEHKCIECGSVISKGEKYYRHAQVNEDGFFTCKMCMACKTVFDRALEGPHRCICFGELWETVGVDYEI